MATSQIKNMPNVTVKTADDVYSAIIHNGYSQDRLFQIDCDTNSSAIPYVQVQFIVHRNGSISIMGQSPGGTWTTIKTYS